MTDFTQNNEDVFLTPAQAAKFLKMSLATFKKLIYQGKIKTLKTPGGHHRIRKSDLFEMVSDNTAYEISNDLTNKETGEIVDELLQDLKNKQKFGHGHASSVAKISLEIAEELNFSADELDRLKLAALLHDVGLLGISGEILNKSIPLNNMEHFVIKTHPLIGEEIVKSVKQLNDLSRIIRQHHEWYDGEGYPDGLAKGAIYREAKVIAVAEAFDSMTAEDSYQKPFSRNQAINRIKASTGSQFDPKTVKAFAKKYPEQ
ncbi:MAG: HD domain-containing phosphohydrolase [Candidatus Scalindua sp.]